MKKTLIDAIADIREDEALELAQALLESGEDPQAVLDAGRQAWSSLANVTRRRLTTFLS